MKSLITLLTLAAGLTIPGGTASAQCAGGVCRAGLGGGRLVQRERSRERTSIVRRVAGVLPIAIVFRSVRERRGH